MRLKKAIRIGKSCGLKDINECYSNIEIHAINFFSIDNVDKELEEITFDISKLSKDYDVQKEDVLKWTISEYELYV